MVCVSKIIFYKSFSEEVLLVFFLLNIFSLFFFFFSKITDTPEQATSLRSRGRTNSTMDMSFQSPGPPVNDSAGKK